ncbi:MAG: chromate transporter [Lachnospiraceae bacterium]|nr:chromate transporter [Lachnospiraceae bacterium]
MVFLQLFFAFLQIGAFSFGGGYAAMPLIKAQVIDTYNWMTIEDFTDLVTIAEMTPGPIAINAATFVGNQVAGIPGAVVATIGVILPSCILVTGLAFLYAKYRSLRLMQGVLRSLRPAVVAMIFAAGLSILIPTIFTDGSIRFAADNIHFFHILCFAGALVALRMFRIGPIKVMIGCGAAELLFTALISL